jgi:hypothetical protein
VGSDDDMAALAAEFPGWHIWRSRSASGAESGWRATRKRRRHARGNGARLAAPSPAALRALLAREEALTAA